MAAQGDSANDAISIIPLELKLGPTGEQQFAYVSYDSTPESRAPSGVILDRVHVTVEVEGRSKDAPVVLKMKRKNAFNLACQILRQCKVIAPIDKIIAGLNYEQCLDNEQRSPRRVS
jgi:hypothetical protein